MNEIFKDITGYEGLYQISNLGRVKSLARTVRFGNSYRLIEEKIKTLTISNTGYLYTNLCKGSKCRPSFVHVLIGKHFISNPSSLPEINHKNGIKTDNRIENLEWVTYSENLLHAYAIGLRKKISPSQGKIDSANHFSKPIAQYDLTGRLVRQWDCSKQVWRETGFNHHNIRNCANGRVNTAYGFVWKFL